MGLDFDQAGNTIVPHARTMARLEEGAFQDGGPGLVVLEISTSTSVRRIRTGHRFNGQLTRLKALSNARSLVSVSMPKNRLDRRLATLSAAVIGAIYAVGYVRTEHADAALGAADVATPLPATSGPAPVNTAPPVLAQPPQPTATSAPSASPTSTSASTSSPTTAYKDGTYTGMGTSRRGSVQVSVTIQSGRIASVTIGRVSTEYPVSDIARLPGEVVSRQSAQVDVVSGATFSSIAFRGAVQQALQQAQA